MSDLILTQKGGAGCITLNRPAALNALTYQMCIDIETQLRIWRDDPSVELIIIDAAGDKAFCAGGDIADLYASAQRQDCLLYTSPSPRDLSTSRMPSSA